MSGKSFKERSRSFQDFFHAVAEGISEGSLLSLEASMRHPAYMQSAIEAERMFDMGFLNNSYVREEWKLFLTDCGINPSIYWQERLHELIEKTKTMSNDQPRFLIRQTLDDREYPWNPE